MPYHVCYFVTHLEAGATVNAETFARVTGTLEETMGPNFLATMQLRTKKTGVKFTDDTILSEFFGNSEDLPVLQYSMQRV